MRRLYRRICLLRATGQNEEASALERSEFSEVLSSARKAPEAAQNETRILAEESERVASASILAELLAPILAKKLQAPVLTSVETTSPAPARKTETSLSAPPRRARVSSAENSESPAAAGVPGIADLIDGMLSQEREYAPARRNT